MNPYALLTDAELCAELHRLAPYEAEHRRRQAVTEQDSRLKRDLAKSRKAAMEALDIARAAFNSAARSRRDLDAEVAARREDRDLIQRRVTRLEEREIDRNRQSARFSRISEMRLAEIERRIADIWDHLGFPERG